MTIPCAPRTLVLDFDGTVCLGDGPVRAYARGVLAHLDAVTAARVVRELDAYLAGDTGPDAPEDGYAAVAQLAGGVVGPDALAEAYAESRRALAAGTVAISAPPGLADLLDSLAGRVRRVLVTNAPETGVHEALARLGLAASIDDVYSDAGKPGGFDALLPALLAGAAPETLLSVGDFWTNDIEPAMRAGCATGYIARLDDPRPAHLRGATLPDLYPGIAAWAAHPSHLVSLHPHTEPAS